MPSSPSSPRSDDLAHSHIANKAYCVVAAGVPDVIHGAIKQGHQDRSKFDSFVKSGREAIPLDAPHRDRSIAALDDLGRQVYVKAFLGETPNFAAILRHHNTPVWQLAEDHLQRPLEVPLPTPAEDFPSPARSIRSRSVNDTPIARHCESATSGHHPESLPRDDTGDIDYGGYDGDVPDYEVSFPRSLDAINSHYDNTDVFGAEKSKGVARKNHLPDPASDCSKSNASDASDAYSPTKGDRRSKRARTQSSAEQKEKNRNYARATDFRKVTKLNKLTSFRSGLDDCMVSALEECRSRSETSAVARLAFLEKVISQTIAASAHLDMQLDKIDAVLPSDVPRNRNEWSNVVEDDDEDIFDVTDWEWSNEAE